MALAEQFRTAFTSAQRRSRGDQILIPLMIVESAVDALQIEGAGIAVTHGLRVPLAASNLEVTLIEKVQTTLGLGPCLAAVSSAEPVVADAMTIRTRWPTYYQELVAKTPFRSTASFPVGLPGQRPFAALDLYSSNPSGAPLWDSGQIQTAIVDPAAAWLAIGIYSEPGPLPGPPWLDAPSVKDRMAVWTAVGMIMEHRRINNTDALASVRRYAQSTNRTLDDVASRLVNRTLRPSDLD